MGGADQEGAPAPATSAAAAAAPTAAAAAVPSLDAGDLELGRVLGEGAYSTVFLARHRASGAQFAVKAVDKHFIRRAGMVPQVLREKAALAALAAAGAPHVARLEFTAQDAATLYFGLELCAGGELLAQVRRAPGGRLPEAAAVFYAAQVVAALGAMRAAGVVHRDLKPENILLTAEGHVRVADFGSAAWAPGSAGAAAEAAAAAAAAAAGGAAGGAPRRRAPPLAGTADYVAPEALAAGGDADVGHAADLWALGCVVHAMLDGAPPFRAPTEFATLQRVAAAAPPRGPAAGSPAARGLVAALLRRDPAARLGARDLGDLRAHAFFAGVEWGALERAPPPPLRPPRPGSEDGGDDDDWDAAALGTALRGARGGGAAGGEGGGT